MSNHRGQAETFRLAVYTPLILAWFLCELQIPSINPLFNIALSWTFTLLADFDFILGKLQLFLASPSFAPIGCQKYAYATKKINIPVGEERHGEYKN